MITHTHTHALIRYAFVIDLHPSAAFAAAASRAAYCRILHRRAPAGGRGPSAARWHRRHVIDRTRHQASDVIIGTY